MLILIWIFLVCETLADITGVDELDPKIEESYEPYEKLERHVLPAYNRKGSEFSLLIHMHRKEVEELKRDRRGNLLGKNEFATKYYYKNTVELYFDKVYLQSFKNKKNFEKDRSGIYILSETTLKSVVPVMPNDLNDPKEFYVFYDMDGSCVLVKIEISKGNRKLSSKNVNCYLMEKHNKITVKKNPYA